MDKRYPEPGYEDASYSRCNGSHIVAIVRTKLRVDCYRVLNTLRRIFI